VTEMAQLPNEHAGALEHALWYASRGFPVVPYHNANKRGECSCGDSECPKPGKHPRIKDHQNRATTDPEKIRQWWNHWTWANITILTGVTSGIVVLDFDGPEGHWVSERLQEKFGKFPPTASSFSGGGGLHVWFRHPGSGIHVPSGDGILGPAADVKADGKDGPSWITVPPSMHMSGRPYRWRNPLDVAGLAPLPDWIPAALEQALETGNPVIAERSSGESYSYRRHDSTKRYELPSSIISGGRNDELYRYGCSLRAKGAEQAELQDEIEKVNESHCSPPLSRREVEVIVKSVMKQPAGAKRAPRREVNRTERPAPPDAPWFEGLSDGPPVNDPSFSGLPSEPPPDIPWGIDPVADAGEPPWGQEPPGDMGPPFGGGGGGGPGGPQGGPPGAPPGPPPPQPVLLAGPDGIPMTDTGNGTRIFNLKGQDMRYVGVMDRWYIFDGRRWQHDTQNRAHRMAAVTARRLHPLFGDCRDEAHQKAWRRHIKSAESAGGINAALKCLSSNIKVSIAPEALDANTKDWFNCPNGLLDLRTMELHAHRRQPMITKISPVAFDPDARCPRWLEFLHEIMGGDQALIDFLQRAVGYAMTGHTTEQCLFFLFGRGRNGKSTFVETIRAMLGDYGSHTDFATFLDRPGDTMRADLARLRGDRMVTSGEPPLGKRFDEGVVKSMTGGDAITCRHMYGDFFEYTPEYKIFLCANVKPTIRGQDDGIWRRFRLIPFTVQIPEERKDLRLGEKLRAEWAGIFRWAAEGAKLWYEGRLRPPPSVLKATEAYREEMDAVGEFVRHCFHIGEGFKGVPVSLVYEIYQDWAKKAGEYVMSQRKLSKVLKERGYESVKKSGVRQYLNWGVRDQEANPYIEEGESDFE